MGSPCAIAQLAARMMPSPATIFDGCAEVQTDFIGFCLATVGLLEFFRKISQNFSPAGVTSPFAARAIPTDNTSVVPVSGR